MRAWFHGWEAWIVAIGILVGAVVVALVVHRIVFSIARRLASRAGTTVDHILIRYAEKPARLILPLVAVVLAVPVLPIRAERIAPLQHAIGLALIAAVGWVVALLADVFTDVLSSRYQLEVQDNLAARRIRTQVQVLRRIFITGVAVVTLGVMLMTFPAIRTMGTSLLASAGLAGLVVGVAMKSTLSSLIAGLQIALTQPIRIEDVVIVRGEWGWIEEIETTYVVVRTWDLRRLIVPLSYFIENTFQNWTRRSADLLGTVFVYVDYTVPVEEVRQQLHRILESSGIWDGKVWALEVTDSDRHTLELRALMSAPNSDNAWKLRCQVREKLIEFLQEKHPQSLPRMRAELERLPSSTNGDEGAGHLSQYARK